MALKDQLFISGVWTDSDVRGDNTIGTPIVSAVPTGDGEIISDTYDLTISSRTGGTATVTVAASANNPFNGRVKTLVPMDNTTVVGTVIPGISIVFDTAGANGDTAQIIVGDPYGPFDASGVGAGVPTAGVRHRVVNTGTADVGSAQAKLLDQAIQYKITGKVFDYVNPFADGATEKVAGGGSFRTMPYEMTLSGISGSGPTKVATLAIDGGTFGADDILDLTTGLTQDGVGLKALGSTYPYQVVAGPLTGLNFSIDPACANADEANILIFPSRYVQIADDVVGVEGTYGTTPVDLTESGHLTGVITPSGVAYYWARYVVPSSANNESNPYPSNIALSSSESTSAGWAE